MFLDHTNPDSIAHNAGKLVPQLKGLRGNARRWQTPIDIRLCSNADGELWVATGDVSYDTTMADACESATIDGSETDEEIASIATELVSEVADQLAVGEDGAS